MKDVRLLLVSAFGLGFLKPAPGTWGSLPPAVVAGAMIALDATPMAINIVMIALLVASSVLCVWLCGHAERALMKKDPREIVVDEVAGQALVLLALPWRVNEAGGTNAPDGGLWVNVSVCALAFVLFRVFDVVKPPPVRRTEALPSGWGVLADDLVAALYAVALVQTLARVGM